MRRFRYGADAVCIASCAAYAVNRWAIPGALKGFFLRGYISDVLFIPAALPLMLWVYKWLGLRVDDASPRWGEILLHLIVWSVAAEVVAPGIFSRAIGDPWDVVAYAVGAGVAGWIWHRR